MEIIKSAEFIKGVVGSDPILKEKIPQIAFVGRSNVGKSSVINALTGTKGLAISSSTPGRTLQLNFFLINEKAYFVDLPGYGYARTSLAQAEKMRKMIMWYLEHNEYKPSKIVLIIDGNVGPKKFDIEMMELLSENGYNVIILANKMDKVKASELVKKQRAIKELLNSENIIYFSSKTKKGKEELLDKIFA
ncbi:MAG TPA: YihA family ribosome biogenesis GTP-binding protein [Candidatus Moranbacteria bacterium]|nr:ribosome biogenesis GTP-binding protein YihA/YsxC [Candidatus Moranbacteria bacterium]HBI33826.1 YihA family ribosome biogenesis GTP-binding protein [Candidatus Moranbacteria bacterium]HBT46066.1 YihA family ribosome biogenesis GTP-binding protein [Candidatus Moranbacteria bacterium]